MTNFIVPNWPAPKHIKAYTTTRLGWGKRTDADNDLTTLLAMPGKPIWLDQKHTNIVVEASSAKDSMVADAIFTSESNEVCVILTADCLPVLICNSSGTVVAAIHAGWRGLANDIIEKTIEALPTTEDLMAWLGPAIGPQQFEVGQDVFDAFVNKYSTAQQAFIPKASNKWLANLYALATQRLQLMGVKAIYGGEYCTFTQQNLFYSYRYDKGKTGRMASVIWISPV